MDPEKARDHSVSKGGDSVAKDAAITTPLATAQGEAGSADEALMLQAAAGDARALEQLYDRHAGKLYNYFLRRLGRIERAQELTHDVFLALLGLGGRYRARAPFVALLYGIARKLLGKEYRSMKRAGRALSEAALPQAAPAWSEESFALREALEKLPARLREPLMLRVYEQLSYEDIARVLRRPIGTVRSRIARAKQALADVLEDRERT
jgi:RNA polymerase sigma-70 factor (ECF subfamily)